MTSIAYVIGGNGFLGRHLVDLMLGGDWQVTVIDPSLDTHPPRPGSVTSRSSRDGRAVLLASAVTAQTLDRARERSGEPDHIFHLGGSGSVGAAAADPALDFHLTVSSTATVLGWLAAAGRGRVTYVSSAAVYGDAVATPLAESRPISPVSVYGVHKAAAEELLRHYYRLFAVRYTVIRFFSLYGPGLRKQLLWDACQKLAAPVAEFGGTGSELRDWLHVDDAVRLTVTAALGDEDELVVNGGTGTATRIDAVIHQLRTVLRSNADVRFSGRGRSGDPHSLVADVSRARRLGFEPRVALADGLVDYARWFTEQPC